MRTGGAIAAAVLAGFALAGCGKEAAKVPERPSPTATVASIATAGGDHTVTDQLGRTVLLPGQVRTVAALSPAAADYAKALGLEAVTRTTDTPAAAFPNAKPAGSAISPDFNAIAAADPDLVLADAAYQSGRTRDFDRFSKPVYVFKAASFEEVLATLTELGKATDREDEAAEARANLEEQADAARAAARAKGGSPRILILTGGGRDVFAAGSETYIGSLLAFLGATNVTGAVADGGPIPGFGVVEIGAAAMLKPDVVLVLNSGQGGLAAQVSSDPAWAASAAVQQKRIIDLDITLFLRAPGPRAGEALETLSKLLWP